MLVTRSLLLALTFVGVLAAGFPLIGCSSRPMMTAEERQANRERESIERPARPIDEETSFTDRVGQVGIVILIVSVTIAGILLPIILLA